MPRTKNPQPPVRKMAPVEEPSSEKEYVLGPTPPPQRELSPEPHSPPSPTQNPQKKGQKIAPLILTNEQEEEIAEWLKSYEYLYIKGKMEYKDTAKMKSL